MKLLRDILGAGGQGDAFAADVVQLIETHLATRSGLRGVALRSAFALARSARPDLLSRAVDRLLPDFINGLQPLYERFQTGPERDFKLFLLKHETEACSALLDIADTHAQRIRHTVIREIYRQLRGSARIELAAAMPAIGSLIRGYM